MGKEIYLEESDKYIRYLKNAEGVYPRFLNLELTSHCNLRCIMCPKTVGFHTHKPDCEISDKVLEKIVSQVLPHVYHINLMGFGEPLLARRKLLKLLEECKRMHITINMITNGQLLTPEISKTLVELGIFNLNVSLDAAKPETYKRIRNTDYEKVIGNLRALKKIKEETGSEYPTLDLSFVGMVDNIAELPEFVRIAYDLGARKVVLQALGEVPDTLVHEKDIFIHNRELGLDNYNKAKMIASDLGIEIELFPPDQFETERDDNLEVHKIPERNGVKLVKDCLEPWNAIFISADSGVSPCCGLSAMGDLDTKDFDDIWFGRELTELREKLKTDQIPQACIYCRGAGWKQPTVVSDEIIIGKNDGQLGVDWYSLDMENGVPLRWSDLKGTYFLKTSGAHAYIEVLSLRPGAALKASADGKELFTVRMGEKKGRDRFYIDPDSLTGDSNSIAEIALETDKVEKPAEKSGFDGRSLGFKFYSHVKAKKAVFEDRWELFINLNKVFNNLNKKKGSIFLNAALKNGEHGTPSLFIHMVKKQSLIPGFLYKLIPDGFLRVMGFLKSGSYIIEPMEIIQNGSRLEQFQLAWTEPISSGKYDVYAGLWHPESGERLKIIESDRNMVDKNRIYLGSVVIR